MTSPIVELLRAGGVPLPRDGTAWRHLLLVHNTGGVPANGAEEDVPMNHGFNLLVLDDAAMPTHFCKFRPARSFQAGHSSFAARLSRVPELSSVMPTTWCIHSDDIEAEVSRYVDGDLLDVRVRSMDPTALRSALNGVLMATAKVSRAAVRVDPSLAAGPDEVEFREAAEWALGMLGAAGLSGETLEPLDVAMRRAGRVRRSVQHGDLWTRNVMEARGHWCLLDFEFFGRIQIPLYDALHLVRTSWDARPAWRSAGPAWIDELVSRSAEGRVYRELLVDAGRAAGLSMIQMGGALVFYVADIGARLFHRLVASEDVEPFLVEVRRLSDWLVSGRHPEDLLGPAR